MNKKISIYIISFFTVLVIGILGYAFLNKDLSTTIVKEPVVPELPVLIPEEIKLKFPAGTPLTTENIGVPVLYYHSIDPSEANELILSPEKLKKQLKYILDEGYIPLSMSELYAHLSNNKEIPKKSIVITFDDGYMDNYTYAFPILKELGINATFFIITNGIDDGYYMPKDQLIELDKAGMDIMAHTESHPYLSKYPYEIQLGELTRSKEKLENILGKPVDFLAYPYGDYNDDTLKATKEAGYKMAFTINRGLASSDTSLLELKRIYVSSIESFDTFKKKLNTYKK